MEKEFVPIDESMVLKELGFDVPCFLYYGRKNILKVFTIDIRDLIRNSKLPPQYSTSPTFSQAFRWFREKHKIYPIFSSPVEGVVKYHIPNVGGDNYSTYEEAELACLKKLIEIVKNK